MFDHPRGGADATSEFWARRLSTATLAIAADYAGFSLLLLLSQLSERWPDPHSGAGGSSPR
jgi:hypothetical protein